MTNRTKGIICKLMIAAILIGLTIWLPRPVAPTAALPALRDEQAVQRLKKEGLYDSLQKAVEATRYQMRWEEQPALTHLPPCYYAPNPAQQLNAYFTSHGLHLAPQRTIRHASDQAEWQADMKLVGYGYGESPLPVGPAELVADENRLEYRRTGLSLTEWYVNKSEGLEQGFTIEAPPGIKPRGERLRLVLELSGDLRAELAEEGLAIALKQTDGHVALRYSDLHAYDAEGHVLPSEMKVSEGRVVLEVEEAGAVYPVTIDPLFNQQQKLTASDGWDRDQFGSSVAINGDTAVVGAVFKYVDSKPEQGSAYVFVRSGMTWSEQQKLTASDGAADDFFGASVAISGNTVVVGAFSDSAYVFVRSGSTWSEQQILTASDGTRADFGSEVAISGETIVVGAPGDYNGADFIQGSAYVFARSGTIWHQQQKLKAAGDGWTVAHFGCSVAISGETIVVGASFDEVGDDSPGAAYVFVRNGIWIQQQKLVATDGEHGDYFGDSVAISEGTVVVGARLAGVGSSVHQGSAYIFVRSGTTWSQQRKLTASDGAADDGFGTSVAISGNMVVVGAWDGDIFHMDQGSAYVFVRSGTSWNQEQKLIASDGEGGDGFGRAVAISSDIVMVGASLDDADSGFINVGSVYIFATWTQRNKLTALDGAADDRFGSSVAISGDTVVVGAPHDDIGTHTDQGSAYVFERIGFFWTKYKLFASDGTAGDKFGNSVAISADTVVVGAQLDNSQRGSAYVFVRSGSTWIQQTKLTASRGEAGDLFGSSVAISEHTVVVGAPWHDNEQGSAYVFVRTGPTWIQQAKLIGGDGAAGDWLGYSVAISGDSIVLGAPGDDIDSRWNQGSAYIFKRTVGPLFTFWSQKQKLTAGDGAGNDNFGSSVAISADTVVVGAPLKNFWRGVVYVFGPDWIGPNWIQQARLTANDGATGDLFGNAVALSGDTLAVGAPGDDIGFNVDQASVYIFARGAGGGWDDWQKLTASDGAAHDRFGISVAVSQNWVVVGADRDDIDSNYDRGSAYVFSR